MKIFSWNVNGIRAIAQKGFLEIIDNNSPDIICLQETKASKEDIVPELQAISGYNAIWHSGKKKGYAGTVVYSKEKPISYKNIFENIPDFSEDGRVIEVEFKDFVLLNIYFPNGGTKADGTEMLTYKLNFYGKFLRYINELRNDRKNIIACGDFNICHTEIDIARPEANKNSIGFLPIERAWISKLIENGYTDVFRYLNPKTLDAYTWWSYRGNARQNNVGWRLDYFFVSEEILPKVKKITHLTNISGSDHCPIMMEM